MRAHLRPLPLSAEHSRQWRTISAASNSSKVRPQLRAYRACKPRIMKTLLVLVLLLFPLVLIRQGSAQDAERQDWPVYPAKEMPSGTNVTEEEALSLTGRELATQAYYLTGTFRVTASGEESAVLRIDGKEGGTRVVVAYPASIPSAPEGAKLVRDATRGFLIKDIRRGADGKFTIWVRNDPALNACFYTAGSHWNTRARFDESPEWWSDGGRLRARTTEYLRSFDCSHDSPFRSGWAKRHAYERILNRAKPTVTFGRGPGLG